MNQNPTHADVTASPDGDTVACAIYPDGVHTVTIVQPDGRTSTVIYVPHDYYGPRLLDVVREHVPWGAPLITSGALADDPDAPAILTERWAFMIAYDTTNSAGAA